MDLLAIFLTGLFAGALTCLAVQGGLLATSIAQRAESTFEKKSTITDDALPIFSFLVAKLISYTLLGLFLGFLGSLLSLSIQTQTILQFAVAIFMIGTALNLLNVHPIFRYFVIQPPRFLTKLVRKRSKSSALFGPAILGTFTVFIPCGTTQAMMALAIASGSPEKGAAIMFAFILGTSPLFFILGFIANRLGDIFKEKFMRPAAIAIIVLALFNLNNAFALSGSNFTFEKISKNIYCTLFFCDRNPFLALAKEKAATEATINLSNFGYSPQIVTVKSGSKIKLNINNVDGSGCIQAFTIPSLGIQRIVRTGTSDTIEFNSPNQPGEIAFMCSMGMYRGTLKVI